MLKKFFSKRNGNIFIAEIKKFNNFKLFKIERSLNHRLISKNKQTERYKKRLDDGHLFYAFLKKKKLIAYYWLSEKKAPLAFGNNIILNKEYLYIWGCYVVKDYRRRGLYKRMLNEAKDVAFKKGKKKLIISANIENKISTDIILKSGFNQILEFKLYKFMNLKLLLINNRFKKIFLDNNLLQLK